MLTALLFLAAASAAQDAQPIVVDAPKPAEEKKVCRTVRETGSRRVKQVCRTAAEQRQDDIDARNKLGMGNRTNRPTETFKSQTGQ